MSPVPKRKRPDRRCQLQPPIRPTVVVEYIQEYNSLEDLLDVLFDVLDPIVHSDRK